MLAFLIASPMFVSLLPVHAQIPRDENSEPLEFSSSPTTGNNSTEWQRDTLFANEKIEVWKGHPSELEIGLSQDGWWYGQTRTNSTWVSMQQTSFITGDYVYMECKNNDSDQIKCWLRGSVTGEYNFWIDLSGGAWYEETNVYSTSGVQINFTDVAVYGFPMIWDETNSRLGIKVSGAFDIDPTISGSVGTGLYQHNEKNQGDIAVTVGHFDYLFLAHSGSNTWASTWENTLQYMFKNSSQAAWNNGTEYYSANRTYAANYPYLQNGVSALQNFDGGWDFKTHGTHIYGFVTTRGGDAKCGHGQTRDGGTAGCWLVFKPVTGSDPDATEIVDEGFTPGQLKLIINASVPCLASVPGTCSTSNDDGPQYSVSVSMNSTGYPAIAYSYKETATGNSNFNWGIVLQRAENPVHATGCVAPDTGLYRACDEFDARNGANGTWTNPQQVDTEAEIIAGGSGHGYIWTNHQLASPAAEYTNYWTDIALCSMGSGNFLVVGKNATIESSTSQDIYARFWYQGNATWGTPFPIDAAGDHHHHDNLDLTCIQNSVADGSLFTAHLVWTKYQYPSDSNITTWVIYTNFTSAAYDGTHVGDKETIWRVDTATADYRETRPENRPENTDIIGHGEIIYSAGIVGDNSTGSVTVFYHTSYGRMYYNTTGWYGSGGFGMGKSGQLYDAGCRETYVSDADDICYNSQYKQPAILSVQPLFNGTDITSYVPIFYSGATGSTKGIGYIQFSNVTSPATFHFYDQQGTSIQIENMTLYYNLNQTSLTVGAGLDCSSCTVGLTPGFYNLTAIHRANTDKKINTTTSQFYIDAGNTTASFLVGNVSIYFHLLDEITQETWDIESMPIYADVWVENEKKTFLVSDDASKTQWLAKEPTNVNVRYQHTGGYNSTRWESSPGPACTSATGCTYNITTYLSDFTAYNAYNYAFTLVDPSVTNFINGTFIIRKYTTSGLIEISEHRIPLNTISTITLIYGEEYVLESRNKDGTKLISLGSFIAGTDLTQTLFIDKITFTPEILIQQKYIHWDAVHNRTAGTVKFWFQDANNRSSIIHYQIWNYSGVQYSGNTTAQEFSLIWTGASSNATQSYFIQFNVDHLDFGEIVESKPIRSHGSPANFINFGRCPSCTTDLIPSDSPWFVYASGAATIFVAGLFSSASATAGTLIVAVWVAMMYQFGFFPGMESIIIVFILLYAIMSVYALRRR